MPAANKKKQHIQISRSPHSREHVPHGNVVDLRSLIAKREAATQPKSATPRVSRASMQFVQRLHRFMQRTPRTPKPSRINVSSQSKQSLHPRKNGAQSQRVAVKSIGARVNPLRTLATPLVVFMFVSLLFVVPASVSAVLSQTRDVQTVVDKSAQTAFEHLKAAGEQLQSFNFKNAETEFQNALAAFQQAQAAVDELGVVVKGLGPYVPGKGTQFSAGTHLIAVGEELSAAGEEISRALGVLSEVDVQHVATNEDAGLTSLLVVIHAALVPAHEHLLIGVRELEAVPLEGVPEEKRSLVAAAQTALPGVQQSVADGIQLTELLLTFLGHDEERRYVVLFQNNHEIRPTGGFIGSLAFIELSRGVVQGLDVPAGGVYDVSGQLRVKVASPQPLHLVNPLWNLQDANWFPHFPSSAQKVQWFFDRTKGEPVDGVITLVPSVIEKLLDITGPIDLTAKHGVMIDSSNFYEEVQVRAEQKFDVTRESKRIISDLTPALFNSLFSAAKDPESLLRIVGALRTSLAEKEILVYMNDPLVQAEFSQRHWSGELQSTDRDYLAVINTNIAGGKTDDSIEETIRHSAVVRANGSVLDTVSITRTHKGASDDVLRNVKNMDYMRIYVPAGSTLQSAEGFIEPNPELFFSDDRAASEDEDLAAITGTVTRDPDTGVYINHEFEKTVFGGWVETAPGESATVTVEYLLPFRLQFDTGFKSVDRYSLLVQKQPGSFGSAFSSTVELPEGVVSIQAYPHTYEGSLTTVLKQDVFAGMVLQRR